MKKKKIVVNVLIGLVFLFGVLTFYSTFSMDTDYVFDSLVYDIEDGYIEGISPNTSIELYLDYFDLENCSIEVVGANNEELLTGFVYNGSRTVLYDSNGTAIGDYINVIKGDYNSDGIIDNNDFYGMGKCLVSDCKMDDYLRRSVDIDDDGEFHINDIMLLDKAITGGYTDISLKDENIVLQTDEVSRLVAKVEPSYGVNGNISWKSSDTSIVTVDEVGRVTGHKEGEAKVVATTLDGKFMAEALVKVDNTIQLYSYNGVAYVGGKELSVGIKSIDYEGITCKVSNENIASCEVKDDMLVMKAKEVGNAKVTVTSPKYGEVIYSLETVSVYLNVMPRYFCISPSSSKWITVSAFNSGGLSFQMSDEEIISDAYMELYNGRNMLRINLGKKQGRASLVVTEEHADTSNTVTIDVSRLTFADQGLITTVGVEASTTIIGHISDDIYCESTDDTKATCRIEGDKLVVTPISNGFINIRIYNEFSFDGYSSNCGINYYSFPVVIQEG